MITKAEKKEWIRNRADELRALPTKAEAAFYNLLNSTCFKFTAQKPTAFCICDAYIKDINLFIEIDGDYHFSPEQQAKDHERTIKLGAVNKMLRFTNKDVLSNPSMVKKEIYCYMVKRINKFEYLSPRHKQIIYDLTKRVIESKDRSIFLEVARNKYSLSFKKANEKTIRKWPPMKQLVEQSLN